jgi:hypothetical protein
MGNKGVDLMCPDDEYQYIACFNKDKFNLFLITQFLK